MHTFTYGDRKSSIRKDKLDAQRAGILKIILSIEDDLNQDKLNQEIELIQKICMSHFVCEEIEMSKDHYPSLKEHSLEHLVLHNTLTGMSDICRNTAGNGRMLKRYLLQWFEEHSEEYDQTYLDFCQNRGHKTGNIKKQYV